MAKIPDARRVKPALMFRGEDTELQAREYRIGDKVRIVHCDGKEHYKGFDNCWNDTMRDIAADKSITAYVISSINDSGIALKNQIYRWPASALELVN